MSTIKHLTVAALLLLTAPPAWAQQGPGPNISGTSIQGDRVELAGFKGKRNVLVVFYRMHT